MMPRPPAGRLIVSQEHSDPLPTEIFNEGSRWGHPFTFSSKSPEVVQFANNCVLFGDGSVASWINSDEDNTKEAEESGLAFKKPSMLFPPKGVERIVKISSGLMPVDYKTPFRCACYFLALREDGKVFVWGDDIWKNQKKLHCPAERLQGIVDIDIDREGGLHVLTCEGRVMSWGNQSSKKHPKNLRDIVRIRDAVGITNNGEVICWGSWVKNPKDFPRIEGIFSGCDGPLAAITQDGRVRGLGPNFDVMDEHLGALNKKVNQVAVYNGEEGCVVLFEDRTVLHVDFSEHFRDRSKNVDLDITINGERHQGILSIGSHSLNGFWVIQEESSGQKTSGEAEATNKVNLVFDDEK